MKNILAICDPEEAYAHRLMEYILQKKTFFLQPAAFSEEESLLSFSGRNQIEVLLISEKMMRDKAGKIQAEKKIILREEKETAEEETPSVYKYQPAGSLLKKVMSFYDAQISIRDTEDGWRKQKKVIGIFSPVGSTGKTSFALVLGQILSRNSEVLYINMEGFSGLGRLLERKFEGGLSDLLYYARQKDAALGGKLAAYTVSVQNLDILPPAETPEDIREVSGKRWMELMNRILNGSSYEYLVLDIGPEVADLALLLKFCSYVFMPVRGDLTAGARIQECEEYLTAAGVDFGKIKKVQLPFHTAFQPGREYCESLIWSELGDFTGKLLKEVGKDAHFRSDF